MIPNEPVVNERGDQRKRTGRAKLETSAGGVVYRVHEGEPLFLLIRDSYRNWGFPKGHLEPEEPPEAAALREVREETGLDALNLDGAIETIDWFFRFRGRLVQRGTTRPHGRSANRRMDSCRASPKTHVPQPQVGTRARLYEMVVWT